jgi:hypothetical protein
MVSFVALSLYEKEGVPPLLYWESRRCHPLGCTYEWSCKSTTSPHLLEGGGRIDIFLGDVGSGGLFFCINYIFQDLGILPAVNYLSWRIGLS